LKWTLHNKVRKESMPIFYKAMAVFSPITTAAPSKAWPAFAHSNPTRGMYVCVCSVFVLSCVGSVLVAGWYPTQGILSTVYMIKKLDYSAHRWWWLLLLLLLLLLLVRCKLEYVSTVWSSITSSDANKLSPSSRSLRPSVVIVLSLMFHILILMP
jgi:hypothetical protein